MDRTRGSDTASLERIRWLIRGTVGVAGKTVLEIGCAKRVCRLGSPLVRCECIRTGCEAIMLLACASEVARPYLTVGDVRSALVRYPDRAFDFVFAGAFWRPAGSDLSSVIAEMEPNRHEQFPLLFRKPKPRILQLRVRLRGGRTRLHDRRVAGQRRIASSHDHGNNSRYRFYKYRRSLPGTKYVVLSAGGKHYINTYRVGRD